MCDKWTKIRNTICSTCLSRDRKLFPAKEVKLGLFFHDILLPKKEDRICWECRANITNMTVFRDKVLKAKALLADVFSGRKHENALQTLTKLTTTTKEDYDETIEDLIKYEFCYPDMKDESVLGTQIFDEPKNESDDEIVSETKTTTNGDCHENVFEDAILFNTVVKIESEPESPIINEPTNESDEETESETEFKSYREQLEAEDARTAHTLQNDKQVVKSSCEESGNAKQLGADHMETDSDSDFSFNDKKKIEDKTSGTQYDTTVKDAYTLKKITEEELMTFREKKRANCGFRKSRHKCLPCLEVFCNQKKLEEHMNSKHSAKKYKCKICEQTFSIKKHLDEHTKSHYRSFVCSACGFEHFQILGMWHHYRRRHDVVNKECAPCGITFPYEVGAFFNSPNRYRTYHGTYFIICEETSSTELEFRKHKREVHSKTYPCHLCNLTFKAKFSLRLHVERVHSANRKRWECTMCHKTYTSQYCVHLHVQRVHTQPKPSNMIKEASYCPECDIQFKDIQTYKIHLTKSLKHNSKDSFKYECEECGYRCQNKSILSVHIEAMHSDLRKYSCQRCEKAFKTKNVLRMHMRKTHEGRQKPRNAVCEICAKAFTSKRQLQQHMVIHTGARPYVCSTCSATFGHSGALYTHNRLKHGTKQSLARKRDTE